MHIIKYETGADTDKLIAEQEAKGLVLAEIANVTEGNFLAFVDNPTPAPTPVEQQIAEIKQRMEEDSLVQFEVLATIYEELLLKG